VRSALEEVKGVKEVSVSLEKKEAVVKYDLSFAITPSARNELTPKRMKANNRDTCQPFFCL
jgi:hypothetical protein